MRFPADLHQERGAKQVAKMLLKKADRDELEASWAGVGLTWAPVDASS